MHSRDQTHFWYCLKVSFQGQRRAGSLPLSNMMQPYPWCCFSAAVEISDPVCLGSFQLSFTHTVHQQNRILLLKTNRHKKSALGNKIKAKPKYPLTTYIYAQQGWWKRVCSFFYWFKLFRNIWHAVSHCVCLSKGSKITTENKKKQQKNKRFFFFLKSPNRMKGNIPKALIFKKNKKLYFPFKIR